MYQDSEVPALVVKKTKDRGPDGDAKDSGPTAETEEEKEERKKQKAELKARTADEQTDACYLIISSLHSDYQSLVENFPNAYDMWKTIVDLWQS